MTLTLELVLVIVAGAIAVYELIDTRGRSLLAWAVLILAAVLVL